MHEVGHTTFCFPTGTETIPDWFEHQIRGPSISFWFRNKFPFVALFFVAKSMSNKCCNNEDLSLKINLFINDYKCTCDGSFVGDILERRPDHSYLCDLQLQNLVRDWRLKPTLDEALLKNEWIHAEIKFESPMMKSVFTEFGIHVLKQKSCMKDIQFTNPSL